VADEVYANGFTVTIDVDFSVSIYRTDTRVGVVQGGTFDLLGGITAVGDRQVGGTGQCMLHAAATDSWAIGDTFGAVDGTPVSLGTLCTGTGTLHSVGNSVKGRGGGSSVTGGSDGIRSTGNGSFILYGNAIGNTVAFNGSGASNQGAGGIVMGRAIGGTAQGSRGAYGCEVNEIEGRNDQCIVTGKFIMPSTNQTSWVNCKAKTGANVQIEIYDELNNPIVCNPLFAQDQASPSDVRLGTIFANGALIGTRAVPPPATVALGVPTDDTTGTLPTAAVVAADLLNEMNASALPIAQGLRDGMGASAAAIAAVGSINVIP
jgi:hypothetical protein